MGHAVLIDHEISELAATELVAELAAELAASFTLVVIKTHHSTSDMNFLMHVTNDTKITTLLCKLRS